MVVENSVEHQLKTTKKMGFLNTNGRFQKNPQTPHPNTKKSAPICEICGSTKKISVHQRNQYL